MNELKALFLLLRLVFLLVRGVLRLFLTTARALVRVVRGAPAAAPPAPVSMMAAPARPLADRAAAERAAVERLMADVRALSTKARALEASCAAEPLCEPLLPTLRTFVLPRLEAALVALRGAEAAKELELLRVSRAELEALVALLSRMAAQRRDPSLAELIDDADALCEACYGPVVAFCRASDVPLSSDRAAAFFGETCSPALGRLDDPTGLAILDLPWQWLAEVQRWPALGHEVGHDFYASVAGLDEELLRRHGLTHAAADASVLDGREGVSQRDVDRIVANWREELVADAFGVMMFGPAYVITTAAIFARPEEPREVVAVEVAEDGTRYEVHPPGHVRVVAASRLLARLGYGMIGVRLEEQWRARHGEPTGILLPVPGGWLRVPDEPFLERAVALGASLHEEGFSALRGIPLADMPGFDFGPREHEAALHARDELLADARVTATDARLLIAGAVLAWAEQPQDGVRLLRAARRAVGKLPLRVPDEGDVAVVLASRPADLVREAFLLDVLLSPPASARALRARP